MGETSSSQSAPAGMREPNGKKLPKAARSWLAFFKQFALIGSLLLLIIVGVLFRLMVYTVHSGEAAVLYFRLFGGTVTGHVFGEGLKIIFPWDILYVYDTKVQERQIDVDVLMTNGLTMYVGVSVRFYPITRDLGRLHKLVGPGYERKIVIPVVSSAVREVLGKYLPEELYSQKREELQTLVEERCRVGVADKFIIIDRLIIRGITMPKLINDSIEAKLEQQQKYQEYVFRIEREKQEAERKRIEAEGIQVHQSIIAKSLSPEVLEFATIEMKRALALSGQNRTIITDLTTERGGKTNAPPPVILNLNDESTASKPPTAWDAGMAQQEISDKMKKAGPPPQSAVTGKTAAPGTDSRGKVEKPPAPQNPGK